MKVEFVDAAGKVLRSFTGTPKDPAPRRAVAAAVASSAAPPPRVGTRKGMNRFTWDLRQEGAVVFPGHDHVGGAAAARSGVAAGEVRRAHHGQRRDEDAATSRSASIRGSMADGITEAYLHEQFKLSSRSARPGDRGEHRGHQDPRAPRSGRRAPEEGAGAPPRGNPEARRRPAEAADARSRKRSTRCAIAAARIR